MEEIKQPGQEADKDDVEKNKVMAILAYIGILVLVPLLAAKDSTFARYHANQGLILFIVWIAVAILGMIPFIGWFIIFPLGMIAVLIFAVLGIINAAKGEMKPLPVIGKYQIIK